MELKYFKEAIEHQIYNFIKSESFLLENDINERTITHKLAEYIQALFQDYNVDCEYNKMIDTSRDWKFTSKRLNLKVLKTDSTDTEWTTVFPDIIVHKRWNNDDNFLIIEVKKKKYSESKRTISETYREFDKRKIKAYMKELSYKNGLYIEFDKTRLSGELKWYPEE